MPKLKNKLIILIILILTIVLLIYLNIKTGERLLTVAFLNIGQGDAVFIEAPNGNQILLDGGPGKQILRELGKVMQFYDRSIDVVIESHPDADHISGLNDVLDKYKINLFMEPGVKGETGTYKNLKNKIESEKIPLIKARRGMVVDLGSDTKLEILFPDQDVTNWETNEASIVAKLTYGSNSFLLTGDSPQKIERYLINLDNQKCSQSSDLACSDLKSEVLKAGHHGSKTSSSEIFVRAVSPIYSVISAGLNNKYGHPNQETLDTLTKLGVKTLRTDTDGRIIFKSDGISLKIAK